MKVNTSRSHKRFNTQHINNLQNVARVFPFILEAKYKTLHVIWALAELEILQKKQSTRGSIDRV